MKVSTIMQWKIQLPSHFKPMTIKALLEDEWLVPRKVRHFLRIRKNVLINDQPALFHNQVYPLDMITVIVEASDYPTPVILNGDKNQVISLYEDEHIIIVNKPYGIKTHPNQPNENGTMLNHVAAYLASEGNSPYVVHRLDKETSGAILFAKNPFVLPILGRRLENKSITRTSQAKVMGSLPRSEMTIDKKIGRHRHDRRKRVIDERSGQTAVTHIKVIRSLPEKNQSWVECQLDTGRTHQIRVHLSSIGHPVLGDPLYMPAFSDSRKNTADRLMLHAKELSFPHPFTGEKISVKALPGLW